MHEAAITQALLDQVRELVPEGSRLTRCRVEVGELEHLDEGVMGSLWRAMTDGSPLEGAALDVERIALLVRCKACGTDFDPEDKAILVCPACGAVRPEVLAGAGVTLRSLEVEEGA